MKKYVLVRGATPSIPPFTWEVYASILNFKTIPIVPSLNPSLIFPFHLLSSPVHPIVFSFYFFPGLLAIFILLSSNNKLLFLSRPPCHFHLVVIERQTSISFQASLPFSSCCHRTTTIPHRGIHPQVPDALGIKFYRFAGITG